MVFLFVLQAKSGNNSLTIKVICFDCFTLNQYKVNTLSKMFIGFHYSRFCGFKCER